MGFRPDSTIGNSGLIMNTGKLVGRSTASSGKLEEITLGTGLSFSGTTLNAASSAANGNRVELSRATPSGVASVDFTSLINSTYEIYEIDLINVKPASPTDLYLRTSTDNGANFDAVSQYNWGCIFLSNATGNAVTNLAVTGASKIELNGNTIDVGSSGQGFCGTIKIWNPSVAQACLVSWNGIFANGSTSTVTVIGSGENTTAADVDAVRILFNGANISSGTIVLYGIKKT